MFARSILFQLGLAVACSAAAYGQVTQVGAHPTDSSGAVVDLTGQEGMLHVRALYVNDGDHTGELQYRMSVRREGSSTSASRQGGAFATVPGRTDTLSSLRINGDSGDHLVIHLVISDNGIVVDSSVVDRPFPDW